MDAARAGLPEPESGPDTFTATPVPAAPPSDPAATGRDDVSTTGGVAGSDGLTQRDRKVLAFERHWWRYAGAKEQAIKVEFGLSATRYYQILNALIDKPGALVVDPMLVRRLRRLRSDRRRARSGHFRPAGA